MSDELNYKPAKREPLVPPRVYKAATRVSLKPERVYSDPNVRLRAREPKYAGRNRIEYVKPSVDETVCYDSRLTFWVKPQEQVSDIGKYDIWFTECGRYRIARTVSRLAGGESYFSAFRCNIPVEMQVAETIDEEGHLVPVKATNFIIRKINGTDLRSLGQAIRFIAKYHAEQCFEELVETNELEVVAYADNKGVAVLPVTATTQKEEGESRPRRSGEKDRFGRSVGTQLARVGEVISPTPHSAKFIAKKAGAKVSSTRSYLYTLRNEGQIVQLENGKFREATEEERKEKNLASVRKADDNSSDPKTSEFPISNGGSAMKVKITAVRKLLGEHLGFKGVDKYDAEKLGEKLKRLDAVADADVVAKIRKKDDDAADLLTALLKAVKKKEKIELTEEKEEKPAKDKKKGKKEEKPAKKSKKEEPEEEEEESDDEDEEEESDEEESDDEEDEDEEEEEEEKPKKSKKDKEKKKSKKDDDDEDEDEDEEEEEESDDDEEEESDDDEDEDDAPPKKKNKDKKKSKKSSEEPTPLDKFGSRIGTRSAKFHDALSKKSKSFADLIEESGVNPAGLQNHLKDLSERGYVEKTSKGWRETGKRHKKKDD